MDSNERSELLEKYWKGETSLEEEKLLFSEQITVSESGTSKHIDQIAAFRSLSLDSDFEQALMDKINERESKSAPLISFIPSVLWKVAAAVLLAFSLYILATPNENLAEQSMASVEEIEDPEEAFEITKQALLLVSAKLNRASELNVGLDKFETTKAKIKMSDPKR